MFLNVDFAIGISLGEGPGVRAPASEVRGVGASDQRSTELHQIQVSPLPGTAAEAEAIAPLLPNATILTEGAATENALKQVQTPRILHIATHGFFLANVDRAAPESRGLGFQSLDNPPSPPMPLPPP